MRLIDADKLQKAIGSYVVDERKLSFNQLYKNEELLKVFELLSAMPTIDAIQTEWIKNRIETLNEYISKWGGSFDHEEMVNAYIHEVSALVRLVNDWRKEE